MIRTILTLMLFFLLIKILAYDFKLLVRVSVIINKRKILKIFRL